MLNKNSWHSWKKHYKLFKSPLNKMCKKETSGTHLKEKWFKLYENNLITQQSHAIIQIPLLNHGSPPLRHTLLTQVRSHGG